MILLADVGLLEDVVDRVGLLSIARGWYQQAFEKLDVEVMVHEDHAPVRVCVR